MAYIDWWNRTGPITMGERFGLNEISTRAKPLSPTKSYIEGGRIGLAQGTPLYTATADNFKFLDNLILNTKKTINEIKSAFGGEPTSGNQGINKLIEAWSASSKDRVVPSERFKTYKLTAESPQVKRVLDLFENKKMSVNAISKKLGIDRKLIRHYFLVADKAEYIGEANAPTGEGKWNYKKTRAKIIKKLTEELKGMKDGEKILKEMTKKLDSIWAKNDEILKMTDKEILNNKTFKEAMNLDVKGLKIGEGINFNRYVDLTPQEYVAKIKAMAKNKEFFQPEHSIPINAKNVKSLYPENIHTAVGKTGGQMEVLKAYIKNNPDGKITDEIKTFLKNQNISLPKSETIGSKAWDVTKKVGKYGIVRPIAGITLPVVKAGESVVETVKAVKEKRLPDYDLTNPQTWMNAAFWNWAVKEWGFDKTVKNFGESLKTLSTGDKARVFRNVVARAGLSPKAIQFISSKVAWPATAAASVYDAYKDYQKRKPDVEKQKELIEQGVVKEEEFDKEEPMFAMGGIASLIK